MRYKVGVKAVGKRLDVYLTEKLPQFSRASIQKLSDQGKVRVNDGVEKHGHKLRRGDAIVVDFDLHELEQIPDIDLEVLYEDEDCLVINKPAGVLSHSKGAFNPEATVGTFILEKLTNLSGDRAGIVHRLDRATSGVIICAKTPGAVTWIQKQFSLRKVKKTYYAVINGALSPEAAIIDMPIERNPKNPKSFWVAASGKPAQTAYETVKIGKHFSLVKLMPKTGRTHQLRVHLRKLGHPIVGDNVYRGAQADRLYLHAESLEITLPNRSRQTFTAPLPQEFNKLVG